MNTKANQRPREKVWGPFFHLLRITKLPWVWILFVAVFTLTRTQLNLLFPSYTQKITAGDVSAATILTMVIVVLGQAVLTGLSGAVSGVATGKISLRFRESVWGRLLKLPVSYFDTHMPRELINRVTQDTTMLSDYISSFPGGILSGIYSLVGTFVILFSYDWHLVMVEAIMIPLVVLCAILEGHLNFLTNKKIQGRMAELTGFLAEIVTHIPLVKTFVKENYEEERGDQCIDDLYRTRFKWSIIGSIANMLLNILIIVNTIVCVAFGAWLCSRGDITVDIWIAFYMYSQSLLISVAGMLNYWSGLKRIQGAALRISQVTAEPVEPETGSGDVSLKNCGLEVKDLSFCYDEKTVLSHVSFTIPHGKTTAIVGPSGSGKSTLLYLLERFYQPTGGAILVGGRDIGSFGLHPWRKAIGYVSQDTLLYSGTIRDNILYGLDGNISEEEFKKAADAACVTEFASRMEDGFDTQVGEGGSKLSGGQRQRIGIARAILRNPELLLLDEVTANLDAESEAEVRRALKNVMAGRTVVEVAHRLDAVQDADQIIVLANGQLQGCGKHPELLKNNELYHNMVDIQRQSYGLEMRCDA